MNFFIPCIPPTATSQQKGACSIKGGGVRFFKKKHVQQAENSLWALLMPHRPETPLEGALRLSVCFYYPWRKSEKKAVVRDHHSMPITSRPDCSNLIKLIEDVMTGLGFWRDDGQISHLEVEKRYTDTPGIYVQIGPCHPTIKNNPK